jgi:hypothetical protein
MIYFDSDMSKSTNMVVYFDWKTVIYIYICGKCRTQFMLPIEKSVTFTGACVNEIIPSIKNLFVYKAKKEAMLEKIIIDHSLQMFENCFHKWSWLYGCVLHRLIQFNLEVT